MKLQYIFGPVISRRLGLSLGIDLIPFKTCSLDCVYCECGKTNQLLIERREYVPTAEVTAELDKYLQSNPNIDYLTFSGSGEPTLHSGLGQIIDFIKENYPQYKISLLTNSTLFPQEGVIKEVKDLDLIVPSLDAVSEDIFNKINRPISGVRAVEIIEGLERLRASFAGQLWLEIFIIPGINDHREELQLFKKALQRIRPDKIQLNSLDRLGTENWVPPVVPKDLELIAQYLGNNIEIVI